MDSMGRYICGGFVETLFLSWISWHILPVIFPWNICWDLPSVVDLLRPYLTLIWWHILSVVLVVMDILGPSLSVVDLLRPSICGGFHDTFSLWFYLSWICWDLSLALPVVDVTRPTWDGFVRAIYLWWICWSCKILERNFKRQILVSQGNLLYNPRQIALYLLRVIRITIYQ